MAHAKLIVVEDNRYLIDMITEHLRAGGYAVDAVRTGAEALSCVAATTYDAMILDLGLPDIDGMEVLRRVRTHSTMPALIVTARDAVAQRIAGLDAGADDYILKPFDLAEFDARLRAVLRRPNLRETTGLSFGDLSFDPVSRTARVDQHTVDLTRREVALFDLLVRHGETIIVRDTLADQLFTAQDDVSSNALDAIVSRLRRKLASAGSRVRIETLRGIGYRLSRAPDSA